MIRFWAPWLLLAALALAIVIPIARRRPAPDRCPVCGMVANPDRVTECEGRTWRFCDMTEDHLARFRQNPEFYLRRLETRTAAARVHRDPVCSMDVGEELSAEHDGRRFYFCSDSCRAKFLDRPGVYASLRCPVCAVDEGRDDVLVSLDGPFVASHLGRFFAFDSLDHQRRFEAGPQRYFTHTMLGIPEPLFLGSLSALLLLSFGGLGVMAWRRSPARVAQAMRREGLAVTPEFRPISIHPSAPARDGPRFELFRWKWLKALATGRWTQRIVRIGMTGLFGLIIATGLFGSRDSAENIAPILTWTIWWAALVLLILYGGHLWCYGCPWDAIAGFLQAPPFLRDRFRRPFTLGWRWPRWGRSVAFAAVCLVAFSWAELGFHVSVDPRLTAFFALAILGMAIVCALVFERRAFCRYGCFVGRTIGLYAGTGALELRHRDTQVCFSCRTKDCFRGNAEGAPCPTWEFPGAMQTNTHCILCGECLRTCPHDNISLWLRPWGADAEGPGKPRMDEAILALVILGITAFHGLAMTPAGRAVSEWFAAAAGLGSLGGYTAALASAMAAPAAVYALLVMLGLGWAGETGVPYRAMFIRFAYTLLPIALFYHLAHNAQHLFVEGVKLVPLASDPFGWGWDLFATADLRLPPLLPLASVWNVQVACIGIGHLLSLWMSDRAARILFSTPGAGMRGQIPMVLGMMAFSAYSLWLVLQPMEMRTSAM
ncbi:MAG: YHS domain-containing protein [Planctomycetes bacterium]|nr:YHS domain-containing protein [Planctomycetota bacterium]